MSKLIHKKGNDNEWLLPEKLYHGTTDNCLESILLSGLKINEKERNSLLSLPMVYLTTSIEMAKGFANSVAFKKGGNPIIIEIDSERLDADLIRFDWNISLLLSSQCIAYSGNIKIKEVITHLDNIKTCQMIFKEPEDINIPVVWDLKNKNTLPHIEKFGIYLKENKILKKCNK